MKQRFPTLICVLMVLFAFGVIAEGELYYPNYNDGRGGTGFFNTQLDLSDVSVVGRPVTSPVVQPLVADLDNNTVNEIIIFDDDNVEIYQTRLLTPKPSLASAEDTIEHAVVFDIDGDNNLEVLTVGGDKASIFDWNSTHLSLTANYTITNCAGATSTQHMVGCRATNDCIVITACVQTGVPSIQNLTGESFNSSGLFKDTTIRTNINNGDWYLPKIRTIETGDYDGDSTIEYIFTAFGYDNDELFIFWMDTNTTSLVTEQTKSITAGQIFSDANRDEFTSPLVDDFDIAEPGLEVVIAYQADSQTEFEMVLYGSDGGELQDYPDLSFEQGVLISNPVKTNIFTDTGAVDFCVMGYDTSANDLNLLCGSAQTSQDTIPGENWQYDDAAYYDLTDSATLYNNMIMSAKHSTGTISGSNLDEIVTPMGVFTPGAVSGAASNVLSLIYLMPSSYQNGAVVSSDVEGVGRDDLLVLNADALWYIDDGFSNNKGEIDSVEFNPCYDSTWQQNTTSSIQVTTYDDEGDVTQARVIWYYGDSNEYDTGWSANASSGTTFSFQHTANATIGAGTIRVLARDGANPGLGNDTQDYAFSVASVGVTFGETECTDDLTTVQDTEDDDAVPPSLTGEGLTTEEIEGTIGILWTSNSKLKLLLGLILVVVLMVRVATWTDNGVVIMASGLIGLVIATAMTLVSSYIMIIVIMGMVMLVFLGKHINGSSTNGGG